MSNSQEPPDLERIAKSAEAELRQIQFGLFSPEGFQRLLDRINEFIRELALESVRIAKRHHSDSVSPAYIDQASEHLASGKPEKWHRVVGGIGGIVLGVGLAAAGSMIQSNQYSTRGFVFSIICIVLGLTAFVFHLMSE
jgi:hypothetical protein